ncbi:hypothetical protein NP493_1248g02056 [Ridgeia piscesae]|uniref:Uncharacterized protein n=1 Tax=Ridgeia piscesae TaxID=27915 RepID=A0AAD9KA85_RIDPI|nr:hypothetical protein NP493_1248g02056 [Ridgeia piscesae]
MDIHSTRAMRGANCWTDHQMLRSKVAFRIREKHNRQGTNEEWAALQQVVYNTAKTYLGEPDRKHQDWFDPNDQERQTLMSRRDQPTRECCKPGALDPPLQHIKMPADCYKNTPVH